MPALRIRFPAGRYHATPWGHHVNEGLVEWPPSPWRLLRALIASGYIKLGWRALPPEARRLFEALAGVLPRFRLPAATVAHSRHYMPTGRLENGRERATLVFDAWAHVGEGCLTVQWDCKLDDDSAVLFTRLANELGYLGRSESWVEAEACPEALGAGFDAFPHTPEVHPGPGWEQITLMAPLPPHRYREWRDCAVRDVLEALQHDAARAGKKKPAKKQDARKAPGSQPSEDAAKRESKTQVRRRARAVAPYPEDLLDALQRDTAFWKEHRWSQPPGSERVVYWRRSDALAIVPTITPRAVQARPIEMALLALTTPSGRASALPPIARVLPQAELLHRALVARVGNGDKVDCPELTGRDADGSPLQGHRHAHVLPLDLDDDGRLDHVLIYARMGLRGPAQRAIRELRRTWTKRGVGELQVAVAGWGTLDDLRSLPPPLGNGVRKILSSPEGDHEWTSETIFVPPRHLKRSGKNSLVGQVQAELAARGYPRPSVSVIPWSGETLHLRHAVRVRRKPAPRPPRDIGFALRLEFDAPVRGPIAIGYGSHFGLGLFGSRNAAF